MRHVAYAKLRSGIYVQIVTMDDLDDDNKLREGQQAMRNESENSQWTLR